MDSEFPTTPFVPWTVEETRRRIAALPGLTKEDLQDLAESLSEGIEDIPEDMRAYYRALRAKLSRRW